MNAPGDDGAQFEQEIKALEEQESQALCRNDVAALKTLWSDDLIVNSTANLIAGKKILIEMIRDGQLRLRIHERRPVRIVISNDVAVATGNEVSQLIGKVAEFKFIVSYMNIWRKREGKWQLAARHLGLIERSRVVAT